MMMGIIIFLREGAFMMGIIRGGIMTRLRGRFLVVMMLVLLVYMLSFMMLMFLFMMLPFLLRKMHFLSVSEPVQSIFFFFLNRIFVETRK